MKNKKILLGMLAIVLTFGMTFIGCGGEGDDNNLYIGEWSGTFTWKDGQEEDATITFTEDTWILATGTKTLNGTYTRDNLKRAAMKVDGDGFRAAYGSILVKLTVAFDNGDNYVGSSGTFTKNITLNIDPFVGSWSGTFKPTGGSDTTATITFNENGGWTLAAGAINITGTYTKSKIGLTATLQKDSYAIGTGIIVNPIDKKLRVDIINNTGNNNGSGNFTKTP
jgi:hypothetical protein